jgi:Type II secretion system (T2SS), protein E, N-terminal domain
VSFLGIEYGELESDRGGRMSVTGVDTYTPAARPRGWADASKERVGCGNPTCPSRWLTFFKNRRRPIFERQWGCGEGCVESMLAAAVRRETGSGDGAESEEPHRHRVPLGLVLLSQGWITHPQLQHALEAQKRAGHGKIGQWLIAEFGLKEERVTRALSVQWSCPVLPMEGFDAAAMALTAPRVLVERFGMVPVRTAGERTLYLAFEEHVDAAAGSALEKMSGLKVQCGVADGTQLQEARERLLASKFVEARVEQATGPESVATKAAAALWKLRPKASQLVRVHRFYWLRMWLESGAMRDGDCGCPATAEDVVDRVYEVESAA